MLFTRRFLLILVVAILGAGCATGPKFAEMKSSIPALRAGDGRIYLYRDSIIGAAIQPKVYLNGTEVGVSQANAFFFIDRPAGDYKVSAASEVERSLSLALAPNETKFVRASISIGLLVGRINFELVNAAGGQTAIEGLTYTGTAAGNSVAAAPNGAIATGSVAPALLMSKADADALEGTWSGNYK